MRRIMAVTAAVLSVCPLGVAEDEPTRSGLALWLDASRPETLKRSDGTVVEWGDLSGNGQVARASGKPTLVEGAMNGRPAIRFSGKDHFVLERYLATRGPVTAFVVSRRIADQAGGGRWQRLLSTCASGKPDNKEPYFCLTGDRRGEPGPYGPVIYVMMKDGIEPAPLGIGARPDGSAGFRGEIGEVLVYERGFVSEDALFDVFRYLERKWGAAIGRENMGWTLAGPLENAPKRVNERWPLSDQANSGGWMPLPEMSDEFDAGALDEAKWQSPAKWKGRPPGLFTRGNVKVGDGMLTLAMRKEDVPEMEKYKGTYHTYTSAYVSTRKLVRYGYFEIRAKAMESAGSSAFWFAAGAKDWRTEIDVFEIGGRAPGKEYSYNMNLHVFREGGKDDHWNTGGTWMAPFRLADDFHVYGLEWSPDVIRYFVDGDGGSSASRVSGSGLRKSGL